MNNMPKITIRRLKYIILYELIIVMNLDLNILFHLYADMGGIINKLARNISRYKNPATAFH